MIRIRRKPSTRLTPVILLSVVGLILLTAGLVPASQTAIARALSLSDGTAWLEMVDKPNQLYTEFSLTHLSGRLIFFGAVDASSCDNSGLTPEGDATDCGLKAAQNLANEWQNRYNAAIIATSKSQKIPPRLLKNIFAWESQFWPETVYKNTFEYGLGHVTMNGADSALRWDPSLYAEICAASFTKEYCTKEYGDQPEDMRNGLQGVLVQKINADCSSCRFNMDLAQAENSIPYIGKTLQANAAYVRYAIKIFTGQSAEDLVNSDDLWRFTLTSYNAGPGCYRTALSNVYYRGLNITWKNLKSYLEPACKGSIPYVEFISKTDAYHPDNDPALHPTPTSEIKPTAAPTKAPQVQAPHSDKQFLAKISSDHLDSALKTLQSFNISKDQVSEPIDASGNRVIQVPPDQLAAVLSALQANPDITSVEPDYLVTMADLPAGYPDDPQYPNQPNLTAAQVYDAWNSLSIATNPGAPVLVAVIDSGVDSSHVDLAGRIYTNPGETNCSDGIDNDHNGYVDDCHGWNVINRDNAPSDDNGHGTEMAGVIGAVTNNATGIAGIAPNVQILPVKVLLSNGVGTHSWAAEGIIYASNMGARVIYLGFAGPGDSDVLRNAIAYATSKGAIVVAPAGNDNGATVNNYPASYPGVISVSAVNNSGTIAGFSTASTYVSLAAPGVGIISTAPGNTYQTASGTSLAAAHVAGIAAMLAGQPQFLNHNDMLRSALFTSALDQGAAGRDPVYGFGIIRANNALTAGVSSATVQITSPAPSSVFAQSQTITFTGIALDITNTNISSTLVWTSNIDGQIGTGASFSISRLTPGAHTITASASGGSASLDIRVLEANGPHGNYSADTAACATCHSSHSETDAKAISAGKSNDFCLSCHNGSRAKAVSTHGNISSQSSFQKQEQNFELLCIQCHDPHGAGSNLFAIRSNLVLGSMPSHFSGMVQGGAVTFTTLDPSSPTSLNNLCVTCHQDSRNPGFPMVRHVGGSSHIILGDQTTQVCIVCHYHDLDGDPKTSDGFMPAITQVVTQQAKVSPTPITTGTPASTPSATATPGSSGNPTITDTPVPTFTMPTETPWPSNGSTATPLPAATNPAP